MSSKISRKQFLKTSLLLSAGSLTTPYVFSAEQPVKPLMKNDRFRIGSIGMRYQGSVIAHKAAAHGDIVAIADVDRVIGGKAVAEFGGKAELYENYLDLLERSDIDIITIGAPDHWHAKMVIDAVNAGKDVYVEKPLTLTIAEGRKIIKAVEKTKKIVQVGTWQRSDSRFRLACEMVRAGRIGKLRKVSVTSGKNPLGGPFKPEQPPQELNWDLWQGPVHAAPYIKEKSHYTFRWWYDYAGGQVTDWGAHIIDIAHWGMGMDLSGPLTVDARVEEKPLDLPNCYNVPPKFNITMKYPQGILLEFYCEGRQGVLFEGTEGRLFVNRATVSGKPVEDLAEKPLTKDDFKLYPADNPNRPDRAGKLDAIINHMGNFFDCVKSRQQPISDIYSQHYSAVACHIANISLRLGRPLQWDSTQEKFIADDQANAMIAREPRKGFEF